MKYIGDDVPGRKQHRTLFISYCWDRWVVHLEKQPAVVSHYCQAAPIWLPGGTLHPWNAPTSELIPNCVGVEPETAAAAAWSSVPEKFLAVQRIQAWKYAKVAGGAFHWGDTRNKGSSKNWQWREAGKAIHISILPLVSGLVSPAGARCAVPPADRGASSASPPAGGRKTVRQAVKESYEAFYDGRES